MVEPKHVALQSISEDSMGRLVFYMYVQLEQGILTLEDVLKSLKVNFCLKQCSLNAESFYINTKYISFHRETNRCTLAVWMELLRQSLLG